MTDVTPDLKCKIARETADYLTPETWTQGTLIDVDGTQIGDEDAEVEFFKDCGTKQKYPVCLVGSLIRACCVHVPDYDWGLTEHHDLTMELANVMANVIDDHFVSGAFGTITQFNDEDEYDEYEEENIDRFPKIKSVANTFADKVCNRGR